MEVKITVPFETAITNKVNSLLDEDTFTEIHRIFAETIDPWTPFLTGALHSDITVESDGVTYNVPYASEKYYGTVYNKSVHPLATSHWDEVAFDSGAKEEFEAKVRQMLIAKAKELYG